LTSPAALVKFYNFKNDDAPNAAREQYLETVGLAIQMRTRLPFSKFLMGCSERPSS
jgi:hypothetical protein